jgi:hypothetical protein
MVITFLKTVVLKNKRRGVVALLSLACLLLMAFVPVASQLRTQKRITGLQLGDAAEGARVTIISDSAMNDYEAFRRGDRFYVKIPLADFTSIPPSFRADGFEDVQVQKSGDGVIVSFRLQPGASARVDQRSNRLDVIFSAPNRIARNNANGASRGTGREIPGGSLSRTSDRNADTAGPIPPGSALAFPRGTVSDATSDANAGRNSRLPFNPSANASRNGNQSLNANNANATKSPSPFPSPLSSPSSVLTPSTNTSYPPLTSTTPANSQTPVNTGAVGSTNWSGRGGAVMKWIAANRLATLLGVLLLLVLIFFLIAVLGRRRKNQAKAKRQQVPKVQPKMQPGFVPPSLASDRESYEVPSAPTPIRASVSPVSSPPTRDLPKEPAIAPSGAVASTPNRTWVLTKPSISSPTAGPGEVSGEEQEREVFEL